MDFSKIYEHTTVRLWLLGNLKFHFMLLYASLVIFHHLSLCHIPTFNLFLTTLVCHLISQLDGLL